VSTPIRLVLLLALAVPSLVRAAEAGCHGSLSGSVQGTFPCTFRIAVVDDSTAVFEIKGMAPIEGVPSYVPGAFQLPRPVKVGTFKLEDLGPGRASVAAEGGTLYTATKTTGQRGEVTLELTGVEPGHVGAVPVCHGSYRARLIPAGAGKAGEVVVVVTF
jgi:hypothetical protein